MPELTEDFMQTTFNISLASIPKYNDQLFNDHVFGINHNGNMVFTVFWVNEQQHLDEYSISYTKTQDGLVYCDHHDDLNMPSN